MIYMPMLKLKQNELRALKACNEEKKEAIGPLFDIPRPESDTEKELLISVDKATKSLRLYWNEGRFAYIDCFDIQPGITINGFHPYYHILDSVRDYKLSPVVGLDREPDQVDAAIRYVRSATCENQRRIGIRLLPDDFDDFGLTELDLSDLIAALPKETLAYDFLIDCRVLSPADVEVTADKISAFIKSSLSSFSPDRFFVSASSIPSSAGAVLGTESEAHIARCEKLLWEEIVGRLGRTEIEKTFYSDYGVVSPQYSDAALSPGLFQSVTTPKIFYTYDYGVFAIRGGAFQTHPRGRDQYYDMASVLVAKPFFRGAGASSGDSYIQECADGNTGRGSPGSWVKETLNSHLEFVVCELWGSP